MNNKLTLIAVVTLNAAAVALTIGGCRSTSGMEADSNRSAYNGTSGGSTLSAGFPGDVGASGVTASTNYKTPPVTQTAPAAVAAPTHAASGADEPMGAPGTEAPAAVATESTSKAKLAETAPIVVEEPKAVGTGHTYVVKSNDSLWVIARREGVTIDELTAANGIKRNAALKPGQKLVIPAASGKKAVASHNVGSTATAKAGVAAPSGDTYTVVSGDVLSSVAHNKLHTTTAALRAANPQLKNDNLRVGQKLNIPNGSKAAAPAKTASGETAPAATASKPSTAAPAAKPSSSLDLPDIAPLGGAPAVAPGAVEAPAPGAVEAPAPGAVDATGVTR